MSIETIKNLLLKGDFLLARRDEDCSNNKYEVKV